MSEDLFANRDEPEDHWLHREAVKKLTAVYASRIFVQPVGQGMVRLSFGEALDDDDPIYHTSIVMTATNAAQFAELIYSTSQAILAPPPIYAPPSPSDPSAPVTNGN